MAVSPSGSSREVSCNHNHLFTNPFCKKVSLIKRIAIIMFHIITLCIPLALYHVISFCTLKSDKKVGVPSIKSSMSSIGSDSLLKQDALTDEAYIKSACDFADRLLEEKPSIRGWRLRGDVAVYPDNDEHTDRMVELYWDHSFKNFRKVLKSHSKDPWQSEEVLEAASELMQVSFAMAELTFKDMDRVSGVEVPAHLSNFSDEEGKKPYSRVITHNQYYVAYTGYYCANVYTWIKAGVFWNDKAKNPRLSFTRQDKIIEKLKGLKSDDYILFSDLSIPEDDVFYEPGTMQNKFRLLYNEYCSNFEACIKGDPLFNDGLKINLPTKDDKPGSFKARFNALANFIYKFTRLDHSY